MYYCYIDSPIGKLFVAGTKSSLHLLSFETNRILHRPLTDWQLKPEYFAACRQQLAEYFSGERQSFDIPYTLSGTEFQQSVLKSVAKIKYGTTEAYSSIAAKIGNPKAIRAVGMANSINKLPIIIPCHRVIGKDGSLTGFGGGLDVKAYLLGLEKVIPFNKGILNEERRKES